MASKNPLGHVKDKFETKAKLVEAVQKLCTEDLWVARTNKDKGLAHVSNAKLLRLHSVFTEVKEKFGTREKLIASILDLSKRGKDEGYKSALGHYPVPRLYDLYKSTAKRNGVAAAAAAPKAAKAPKAAQAPKAAGDKPKAAPKKTAAKKA